MKSGKKSPAPALERGLEILEKVTRGKNGVGFKQLAEELALPESSVVRYLKVLTGRGYIRKDSGSGLYYPGNALRGLIKSDSPADVIRAKLGPTLKNIMRITGNTALFIHWNGSYLQCLGKELNEHSIVMQHVNEIRHDILKYPWSAYLYNEFSDMRKKHELDQCPNRSQRKELLESAYRYFLDNGFGYEESASLRRLWTPVFMKESEFCGVLAIGGTWESIPGNTVKKFGKCLKDYAIQLNEELRMKS